MKSKGIRIQDAKENDVLSVGLSDILEEIRDGSTFNWSILEIDALGKIGAGLSYLDLVKKIEDSENGLFISWDDLNVMSRKLHQILWITIIGCKDEKLLRFYENDQEMYETCDIVIQMIDSGYWEVFSKNEQLINRLASKFKEIEFLEPNFEK